MSNKTKNSLMPKIRFKKYSESWNSEPIEKIINVSSKKYNPEKDNANYNCIELEHLSQNTGQLLGFIDSNKSNSIKNKFNKGDVLYGKLRPYLRKYLLAPFDGVCSSEIWVLTGKGISNSFLYQYVQTNNFNDLTKLATGTKMPRADWSSISKSKIAFPSLPEQEKIAAFLGAVDEKIQQLTRKKQLLEQYKKGVMQQLFSGKLRFKDDNGKAYPKWEERKFADILNEHKQKSSGKEEVFSVSVHKGLVNQVEHLGRVFAAKNTDNYNLVKPGDIVYTKSPTGDFPLGIIKQSKLDKDVIVSPLYGVFTPETKGLGYLLNVYFETPSNVTNYLSSIIQKGAKNTINITNTTFLSKKMKLPVSKEEQTNIGNFLMLIDKKINQIQEELDKSNQFKKGLLQQMFV